MEHSKHIWRAALILLFLGTGFVGVRHFLIPKSFGQAGHYRYDSIFEYMAQEPNHGSRESCRKCHEEKFAETVKGRHAPVQCEVCHAPVSAHAKDDKKIADMPTNPNHKLCALCHQKLDSRPKGFPQVDLRRHLAGGGRTVAATIPDAACFECHSAHEPSPLRGERKECKKCHDDPFSVAAAGKHSSLSCEVCHGPRASHVNKEGEKIAAMPKEYDYNLCLRCHDRPTTGGHIPQIELRAHLEKVRRSTAQGIPKDVCRECHQHPHGPVIPKPK